MYRVYPLRQLVRVVKETDLKSVGPCPHRFESCSCRLSDRIMVSIPACHAGDQGSIPCSRVNKSKKNRTNQKNSTIKINTLGVLVTFIPSKDTHRVRFPEGVVAIAQLGERKTEDLKVTGSIPVGDMVGVV